MQRHNVVLTSADIESPLQVGNGQFAVTVDITGLQTFAEAYQQATPLGTMAQWAWHTFQKPENLDLEDVYTSYNSHGRMVPYADGKRPFATDAPPDTDHPAVWSRANPHRFSLGRIGLRLERASGSDIRLPELQRVRQELDLWTGRIESSFALDGEEVSVSTLCHPIQDQLAVQVRSRLVSSGRLGLFIRFPYAAGEWKRVENWTSASRHQTDVAERDGRARIERRLDDTSYFAAAAWSGRARWRRRGPHEFEITPAGGTPAVDLCIAFAPEDVAEVPSFQQTRTAAAEHWRVFWARGGAVDFAGCRDTRSRELERRVVLSQYLTAVNCAGSIPPQETGLVVNSWYGKHHLEMHWWHAAHFTLWGRAHLLAASMPWYERILPVARDIARRQGYRGARWPKQVGIDGSQSPSPIGVFLIWQQPHPIYYAELLYRAEPGRGTLEKYARIVFESAEFMASYAAWEESGQRYVLGPPLVPAQESYGPIKHRVINPTFELAYWRWGLAIAQTWRQRLDLQRVPLWDRIIEHLSWPTVRAGVYAAVEVEPFTLYSDHPSMLAALGFLPGSPMIDVGVMRQTLDDVWARWDWKSTWGWDYPMMAMTAARVGEPARAVDALLMAVQKNRYLRNGHNVQDKERLPLYLPGNGGLLYAVALMAAGWDGESAQAPGFPRDGSWPVRTEGLLKAP